MYETIEPEYRKTILPRLVERTGRLVYTAEKNLGALLESGLINKEDIPRIDNALVEFDFAPVERATLGIPDDAFVLTNVSRAFDFKGWAEGIDAVTIARKESGADIHLILVGEGPEFDRLSKAGVPDYIHLEGFQSNIRGYFATSDMGFLPSRFHGESFPLVLIDCLIAGQPFLGTSVGEIPYMLNSENGMAGEMVDLTNWEIPVDELAALITKLAVDKKYYNILKSNVPFALQKFDTGLLQKNYDAVYSDLSDSNGI
jgi:glycosyltransferase involved in cell wall biosynthesis